MHGIVLEPSPAEFARRRGSANLVPVSCELLADLDTPISAYMKLRDLPATFLLESVEGAAQVARFSVLGGDPRLVLESDGTDVRVTAAGATTVERGDPLGTVRRHLARYRAEPRADLPPFVGGFLGYLGYDTVRLWERLPHRPPDDLGLPVFRLGLMDTVVVFDHLRHTLRIVANADVEGTDGTVPGYVCGTYYLNGPARFARNGTRYRHWLDGDGRVLAFDASSGSLIWQVAVGNGAARPVADSTRLFFGTLGGHLLALSQATGRRFRIGLPLHCAYLADCASVQMIIGVANLRFAQPASRTRIGGGVFRRLKLQLFFIWHESQV